MTIEFDYPSPDTTIPWEVKDITQGIVVRYRRTIAGKTRPISGTGGYRYGVDFHTELHCAACCCEASEDQGCRHPAGGFTVISSKSGHSHIWGVAIASMADIHLHDPLRHDGGRST